MPDTAELTALVQAHSSRRKARWRSRQRRGLVCARVEVSATGLDFLIATRWLREVDAADVIEIGNAISRMLEDSGRRK